MQTGAKYGKSAECKIEMKKKMKIATALAAAAAAAFSLLYKFRSVGIFYSLAITFGTAFYHLAMRLSVGFIVGVIMNNKADFRSRRFAVGKSEMSFYEKLNVKNLMSGMPAYEPDTFNPKLHSWEEIAMAGCQAERVHEIIALLSFLPIAAGVWFGAYPVFIITSVLSAAFDFSFVIRQRYNRARITAFLERKKESEKRMSENRK